MAVQLGNGTGITKQDVPISELIKKLPADKVLKPPAPQAEPQAAPEPDNTPTGEDTSGGGGVQADNPKKWIVWAVLGGGLLLLIVILYLIFKKK